MTNIMTINILFNHLYDQSYAQNLRKDEIDTQ